MKCKPHQLQTPSKPLPRAHGYIKLHLHETLCLCIIYPYSHAHTVISPCWHLMNGNSHKVLQFLCFMQTYSVTNFWFLSNPNRSSEIMNRLPIETFFKLVLTTTKTQHKIISEKQKHNTELSFRSKNPSEVQCFPLKSCVLWGDKGREQNNQAGWKAAVMHLVISLC